MVQRIWQSGLLLLAVFLPLASDTALGQYAPYAHPPAPAAPPGWNIRPFPNRQAPTPPHPAVCRIVAPERNAVSYGSGTLVDVRGEHGLVLTNWHVVRDATEKIEVVFPDGFRCAARVLKTDKDWDLAALAVWRPNAEPVKLAAVPPARGDVLTIAGYGSGNYRAASGHCTQYVSPSARLPFEMVEISTEARQGDSGGPIFNTQGELAGVLFGAGQGTTSGSHSGRVSLFLASLAPDVGKVDVSKIASSAPRREEPAVPPPAFVNSSPGRAKPNAKQPDEYAVADFGPARERLAPVAPAPSTEKQERWPSAPPLPRADHVAAEFGGMPGVRPIAEPPPAASKSLPLEARVDLSRPSPGITWQAVAGDTLVSQAKTVLAAVGVLALFVHGLRLVGKSTPKGKKQADDEEDDEDDE
jgi:S1-C subfamily serine protease